MDSDYCFQDSDCVTITEYFDINCVGNKCVVYEIYEKVPVCSNKQCLIIYEPITQGRFNNNQYENLLTNSSQTNFYHEDSLTNSSQPNFYDTTKCLLDFYYQILMLVSILLILCTMFEAIAEILKIIFNIKKQKNSFRSRMII